jgi:hypothetical protein
VTKMQTKRKSHAEVWANTIIGQILYFGVMFAFGTPIVLSLKIQGVGFVVSYARQYLIRRAFNKL